MANKITINILNDNRPLANHFCSEHGLSVMIQTNQFSLLLDTGQTDKYLRNAVQMGIDVADVTAIVLSHGHYDHAGGLAYFPIMQNKKDLFVGPNVTQTRYSHSSVMLKNNGFPQPQCLQNFVVHTVSGIFQLNKYVTLFTLPHPAPINEKLLSLASDGQALQPDSFPDELFTLINYEGKTILFGGCTHHGLEQLFSFCKLHFGLKSLSAFVGGLHLSGQTTDAISNIANKIEKYVNVNKWIVNHCTGEDAINYWYKKYGSIPSEGYSGSIITI